MTQFGPDFVAETGKVKVDACAGNLRLSESSLALVGGNAVFQHFVLWRMLTCYIGCVHFLATVFCFFSDKKKGAQIYQVHFRQRAIIRASRATGTGAAPVTVPVAAVTWPWPLLTTIMSLVYSEKAPRPSDRSHRGPCLLTAWAVATAGCQSWVVSRQYSSPRLVGTPHIQAKVSLDDRWPFVTGRPNFKDVIILWVRNK